MAEKSTFIKLDRNILEWGWYQNVNTKVLFLHCLLRANWKPGVWKGQKYERGEFITSIKSLADETGLTEQTVRTALKNLKLTGELTNKTTSKYSVITVNNYDKYQSIDNEFERQQADCVNKLLTQDKSKKNQQGNQQGKKTKQTLYLSDFESDSKFSANKVSNKELTNNQQTTNKQLTTVQEYKNNRSVRSSSSELPPPTQNDIFSFAAENNLGNVDCIQFFTYYDCSGWKTKKGEPITDWQSLLIRWNKTEKVKPKESQEGIAAYDLDLFEKMVNEKD